MEQATTPRARPAPKRLVEDCLILDLAALRWQGLFERDRAKGLIHWHSPVSGEVLGKIGFGLWPDGDERRLLLLYRAERTAPPSASSGGAPGGAKASNPGDECEYISEAVPLEPHRL